MSKNFPFIFLSILKKKHRKYKKLFLVCAKQMMKKFDLKKNGSAQEFVVSWLYYGDIKIRDTFVHEHVLTWGGPGAGAGLQMWSPFFRWVMGLHKKWKRFHQSLYSELFFFFSLSFITLAELRRIFSCSFFWAHDIIFMAESFICAETSQFLVLSH